MAKDLDHGWREDELDSTNIFPEKTDELLSSLKHGGIKTEREKVLEKVVNSRYDTYNDLNKLLNKAEEYLDSGLIQKHFNFNTLGDMLNYLFKTRDNYKTPARISLIKAGLRDLRNEIEQMSGIGISENNPDVIVNFVEKILDANERRLDKCYFPREPPIDKDFGLAFRKMYGDEEISDIFDLESEESATKRRKKSGKGLKILTTQQMLSRLPISLAQLKAENNSEKLKNEIRQLLYSLFRSKKLSKTIYESLIKAT